MSSRVCLKSGAMLKQGQIAKNWKQRWFVLSPQSLSYFTDDSCKNLCGIIPVADMFEMLVGDAEEWNKMTGAFILKTAIRDYYFMLEDEEAGDGTANNPPINNDMTRKCKEDALRDEWVIAISKAMVELQEQKRAVAEQHRQQQLQHQSKTQSRV